MLICVAICVVIVMGVGTTATLARRGKVVRDASRDDDGAHRWRPPEPAPQGHSSRNFQ